MIGLLIHDMQVAILYQIIQLSLATEDVEISAEDDPTVTGEQNIQLMELLFSGGSGQGEMGHKEREIFLQAYFIERLLHAV